MKSGDELKASVREKYGEIADLSQRELDASTCCGTQCCGDAHDFTSFSDDYSGLKGYHPGADLKLGCGVPTEVAGIREGDTVLDLGSGAGNDAFVARALVGERGRVLGVDMTERMVEKARKNVANLGFTNVEFRLGDIEALPVESDSIDVVISNCVLNLVPDKRKAFAEMYRVLRPGGHFSVSDIVLTRALPAGLREGAEMYAGCVSGAIEQREYLALLEEAGFQGVEVKLEKPITLPQEVLARYLSEVELRGYLAAGSPIASVTVYGVK